jgi:hypothetical protein
MMLTRRTAFNKRVEQGGLIRCKKMKEIKFMLTVFVLTSAVLTAVSTSDYSWDLGSSKDWLSVGPVTHIGPYYFPNSDLPMGIQRFLNTHPIYMPLGYSNSYLTYNPMVPDKIGAHKQLGNQLLGYNDPYFYDPQAGLDRAIANHAFEKYLNNYYSKYGYYGSYP